MNKQPQSLWVWAAAYLLKRDVDSSARVVEAKVRNRYLGGHLAPFRAAEIQRKHSD